MQPSTSCIAEKEKEAGFSDSDSKDSSEYFGEELSDEDTDGGSDRGFGTGSKGRKVRITKKKEASKKSTKRMRDDSYDEEFDERIRCHIFLSIFLSF